VKGEVMSEQIASVKAIFDRALEIESAADRQAFLEKACAGDAELRRKVEGLLRAYEQAGEFVQGPAPALGATADAPPPAAEGPGTRVGHYKLLQQIGEGGMGTVWMAEQTEPVRRRVALKLIKPGLDSAQVIARFEAERQALALMDHENIARVLDAGTTAQGRPYFVMELVHGIPLTKYCDEAQLSVRERLGLFVPVCRAVQHAHQKGIIHRDLKPSNILVTLHDGRPVPKIIDFGVAKATEQRLTDRTLFTHYGAIVGTPEYMAPEQAEMSGLGVDTRSDVYSLGVLLYELLTGSTPLERSRLKRAALDEVLRLIREEEPPRPSTRLSRSGEALATISARRRAEPAKLAGVLRGELDWIVMKCLEKDRTRRYETANGLARDVERYLTDEPVEACPPSAGYRLRKFARKYRTALATTVAFAALLVAGTAFSAWQAVRATLAEHEANDARQAEAERARQQAEAERQQAAQQAQRSQGINDALTQAATLQAQARAAGGPKAQALAARARGLAQRARALLEGGPVEPALAARVQALLGDLDQEERDRQLLADLEAAGLAQAVTNDQHTRYARERAVPLFREAIGAYGLPAGQGEAGGVAARIKGRPVEVREALLGALDEWVALAEDPQFGVEEPHLAWLRAVLAAAEPDGWGKQFREAAALKDPAKRRAALEGLADRADVDHLSARALARLGVRLKQAGAAASAVRLLRRAQARYPADFWVNHGLGNALDALRPPEPSEAGRYLTAAVALRPDSAVAHVNLGLALQRQGRLDQAVAEYRKALALAPKLLSAHNNLGLALVAQGKLDEAIAELHRAIELNPKFAGVHTNLGLALERQGKLNEAAAAYRRAIELDARYAVPHVNLGLTLAQQGKPGEAVAEFRRAIEIDPSYAEPHAHLGYALSQQGKLEEAAAECRRAITLDPRLALGHANLGKVLREQNKLDEAVAAHRQALTLEPNNSMTHNNLGVALFRQGKLGEATAEWRRAIALDPKSAPAHANFGDALRQQGQLEEALAECRRAVALDPKPAPSHGTLGLVLFLLGEVDEAAAAFRRALELDAKYPQAQAGLALALMTQGRLVEARAGFRRLQDLVHPGHPLQSIASRQPGECERLLALERKLPDVLAGKEQPAGASERLGYAWLCDCKGLHAEAARRYAEVFTGEQKWSDDLRAGYRYDAARAAAQAGCGKGEDAAKLDEEGRARWRRKARTWLRSDMARRAQLLAGGTPLERRDALQNLYRWRHDPALAGLREAAELARLPAAEQEVCRRLWGEVAVLLRKAGGSRP
jgi:serine/threonine protein kinase/tetratricopeptide (TPR) repeat protein